MTYKSIQQILRFFPLRSTNLVNLEAKNYLFLNTKVARLNKKSYWSLRLLYLLNSMTDRENLKQLLKIFAFDQKNKFINVAKLHKDIFCI